MSKLRRIELEATRLARLDELQARWTSRAHEIEQRAEQSELVRRAAARTKTHNREVKLATLEQQQRTQIEELRSKILKKVSGSVAHSVLPSLFPSAPPIRLDDSTRSRPDSERHLIITISFF